MRMICMDFSNHLSFLTTSLFVFIYVQCTCIYLLNFFCIHVDLLTPDKNWPTSVWLVVFIVIKSMKRLGCIDPRNDFDLMVKTAATAKWFEYAVLLTFLAAFANQWSFLHALPFTISDIILTFCWTGLAFVICSWLNATENCIVIKVILSRQACIWARQSHSSALWNHTARLVGEN